MAIIRYTVYTLLGAIILSCVGPRQESGNELNRLSPILAEVVERHASTPFDTTLTVAIRGLRTDTLSRRQMMTKCGPVIDHLFVSDSLTMAYVPSRLIPCLSRLPWVLSIEESQYPLPIP